MAETIALLLAAPASMSAWSIALNDVHITWAVGREVGHGGDSQAQASLVHCYLHGGFVLCAKLCDRRHENVIGHLGCNYTYQHLESVKHIPQ